LPSCTLSSVIACRPLHSARYFCILHSALYPLLSHVARCTLHAYTALCSLHSILCYRMSPAALCPLFLHFALSTLPFALCTLHFCSRTPLPALGSQLSSLPLHLDPALPISFVLLITLFPFSSHLAYCSCASYFSGAHPLKGGFCALLPLLFLLSSCPYPCYGWSHSFFSLDLYKSGIPFSFSQSNFLPVIFLAYLLMFAYNFRSCNIGVGPVPLPSC
jgi:hypothetical protein